MDAAFFGVIFVFNIGLSLLVAYVAKSKNRSPIAFFFLSFFFSFIVGILVALAIAPGTDNAPTTKCEHCKEVINAEATTCKHCGKSVKPNLQAVQQKSIEDEDTKRGTQLIYGIIFALIFLVVLITSFSWGFNVVLLIILLLSGILSGLNIYRAYKSTNK